MELSRVLRSVLTPACPLTLGQPPSLHTLCIRTAAIYATTSLYEFHHHSREGRRVEGGAGAEGGNHVVMEGGGGASGAAMANQQSDINVRYRINKIIKISFRKIVNYFYGFVD